MQWHLVVECINYSSVFLFQTEVVRLKNLSGTVVHPSGKAVHPFGKAVHPSEIIVSPGYPSYSENAALGVQLLLVASPSFPSYSEHTAHGR